MSKTPTEDVWWMDALKKAKWNYCIVIIAIASPAISFHFPPPRFRTPSSSQPHFDFNGAFFVWENYTICRCVSWSLISVSVFFTLRADRRTWGDLCQHSLMIFESSLKNFDLFHLVGISGLKPSSQTTFLMSSKDGSGGTHSLYGIS